MIKPDDCPFCMRIVRSEYDTRVMSVVSFEPLNPVTPGHRLFLPVSHHEHNTIRSAYWVGRCMQVAEEHALTGVRVPRPHNLIVSNGSAATQTVPHLHVHYVPRAPGDGLHLPWTGQVKE